MGLLPNVGDDGDGGGADSPCRGGNCCAADRAESSWSRTESADCANTGGGGDGGDDNDNGGDEVDGDDDRDGMTEFKDTNREESSWSRCVFFFCFCLCFVLASSDSDRNNFVGAGTFVELGQVSSLLPRFKIWASSASKQ